MEGVRQVWEADVPAKLQPVPTGKFRASCLVGRQGPPCAPAPSRMHTFSSVAFPAAIAAAVTPTQSVEAERLAAPPPLAATRKEYLAAGAKGPEGQGLGWDGGLAGVAVLHPRCMHACMHAHAGKPGLSRLLLQASPRAPGSKPRQPSPRWLSRAR